jgi:hypothetical protein
VTYGQIRLRLAKANPGVDLELIDGWIQDRYTEMLDALPWKRLEGEIVLQSPPSYQTGTLAAQQGSANITGSGTAWTAAMDGLTIRIANASEYYMFTYVSATAGTLDRAYEQPTGAIDTATPDAAGAGYAVGDLFTIAGGSPVLAQGQVVSVNGSGGVTAFDIAAGGSNYSVASGVATTASTGVGSGLTLNITAVGQSSGFSYRIDQNIWQMPAGCRIVRGVRPLHDLDHPLKLVSPGELNRIDPQRATYGTPYYAAPTWDSSADPPSMQVELYPVPTSPDTAGATLSWVVDYICDPAAIDPTQTSASLLPWTRPAALIAGVEAEISASKGDTAKATLKEARFQALLRQTMQINALQRGSSPMRLARELKRGPNLRDARNELRSLLGPGAWRDGYSG